MTIKTAHFTLEVLQEKEGKEAKIMVQYSPVARIEGKLDIAIKVDGNKLITTATEYDDGEDTEIFEIPLEQEQAEKLRGVINQIQSFEDLKNLEEALAETEKEVERKIFERMDDVENEIANMGDSKCMEKIRKLDSEEIDETLMRAIMTSSEPNEDLKEDLKEEPTFEEEIVEGDPIDLGGIEDILSGKLRDKEDKKDIEAEIADVINEIFALITSLDYSTKYMERLYSLNTDDIIQILMVTICGCDEEPEETVENEPKFDVNVEDVTDLEKVGKCMISKTKRLVFTRMPTNDALEHFSLDPAKYKNFEIKIEKNKVKGKRLGFVSIEYNQKDDFEKDVEAICKES